jgi:hypothetical protein
MLKFLKEVLSGPNGQASSKRTVGWALILSAIVIGCIGAFSMHVNTTIFEVVFVGFITGGLSALGLTSFDSKQYFASFGKQGGQPNNQNGYNGENTFPMDNTFPTDNTFMNTPNVNHMNNVPMNNSMNEIVVPPMDLNSMMTNISQPENNKKAKKSGN